MSSQGTVIIDNRPVPIEGEKNLLTLIRKAHIEIPTFCYHSELSTYGACRLCLVEINGKQIDASCVVPPRDGMVVRTSTPRIRAMRRMNLELLLANHTMDCPTCVRSDDCKLRSLSSQLGVETVRFPRTREERQPDTGSVSLVRDANKCILCGDCVRYCSEVQGIGAIDFAFRGEDVTVTPAFGRSLGEVDCVNCGQCAAVCPTGAIVPRSEIDDVWQVLQDPDRIVVAQIAPAVRVALGEMFSLGDGQAQTGRIVTALRMLGFDRVYDTCFGADLTVLEEATELRRRRAEGGTPLFTSCCPAWVKFAEQSFPELLPNLSTCKSPQAMVGTLAKATPVVGASRRQRGDSPENGEPRVTVVSIMPCTAKKFEARRPELSVGTEAAVDLVLTTTELGRMIQEAGIRFSDLPVDSMDLPMGMPSGAGVIFGASGGVGEAVARFLVRETTGRIDVPVVFEPVPGETGVRTTKVELPGDEVITVAVVQGLANARRVAAQVKSGESPYDLIEVMACPGGCIGGAGQPVATATRVRMQRRTGLYQDEAQLPLRRSHENPFVHQVYAEHLGGAPGSETAHRLLHTHYRPRKRIQDLPIPLIRGTREERLQVKVCVGTSCFLRGSQHLLQSLMTRIADDGLEAFVDLSATFCSEQCSSGPTVEVGDVRITGADVEQVTAELDRQMEMLSIPVKTV